MATKSDFTYRLLEIRCKQFAVLDENFDVSKSLDEDINMLIQVSIGVDTNRKVIASSFKFELKYKLSTILVIEPELYFEIEDNSWNSLLNENGTILKIPKALASNLLGLSISTARGMLYEKTVGTELNKFMIPLLDPTQYADENVKFKIPKIKSETSKLDK